MIIFVSWLSGLVFGLGLILSGMVNPAKVLGFLDMAGDWDPTLLCVMAGAVAVSAVGFLVARQRTLSYLGAAMQVPTSRDVDGKLVVGSLLFGMGWGLAGFCPGPALVALGMLEIKAALFVAAMLVGMGSFELAQARPQAGTPAREA